MAQGMGAVIVQSVGQTLLHSVELSNVEAVASTDVNKSDRGQLKDT
jgi:hypothetical protein